MTAKILTMPTPKYNQAEFDDMFKGFIQQVDKLVAAKDMNAVVGMPKKEPDARPIQK